MFADPSFNLLSELNADDDQKSKLIPGGGLEPPVMSEMSEARRQGHEWDAIDQYMDQRRQASRLGGYSDAEVDQYLGYKSPELRLNAIGQEANFLTYANDADGTASPAQSIAHASGNLFQPTALGKPLMQDGPVPPELRAEYAQGLMGGEFPDAGHFAQSYTSGIFNAAGLDGDHPLAKQATDELTDKLPKTQDLIDWSLALHGDPTLVRQSLMQHWVDTGEPPQEAYQRAMTDNDFRLDIMTPKPAMPATIPAKVQAHYGDPTLEDRFLNIWGGSDLLPGADTLQPTASGVMSEIGHSFADGLSFDTPAVHALQAAGKGFQVGVQGTYDWLVANKFVDPEKGTFYPPNLASKALGLPFAILAGAGEGVGDMFEKYGEEIGQPLLGRSMKELVVNWGGLLGSPHGVSVHEMDPAMLNKIDSTVRLLMDTAVDSSGAGNVANRAAPLGRNPGDIMPPTSGAFNRFHEQLPAGTVLPFGDAGVRVHDDVRQFQGNVAADRTDWNAQERRWAKSNPEWFKPDFLQRVTDEVEQRGVDGTALSPEVDAFWSHPEWKGARQAAFKDWSDHELRMAAEEGREPANRALEPFDDNFIPRHLYNDKAAADPLVPQWLEEAEPEAFGRSTFRRRSGPALRTEGRQFYVREYEDGSREVAANNRSTDKVQFGDQGRFRGKNFTVRDATIQEITDATADHRVRLGLPDVAEGKTRLFKAERAEDDAPAEGWVNKIEHAEQDLREGKESGARTGKIQYIDVARGEREAQPRPLYTDPETGKLVQDPSFPRRYNLDENLFPTGSIDTGPVAKAVAGREPKDVPYGEPRPQPAYRTNPIQNLRDSWLSNRMKSYGAQFLIKSRSELEDMGLFKRPDDALGNWQTEKAPTFKYKDAKGKVTTQAGAQIDLPLGFKGWVPKDLKLEFDRYLGPLRSDSPTDRLFDAWDKANRFLIRSLFVSPLPHEFNVMAHYVVGRGLWGTLGPPGAYRGVRYTGEAAYHVLNNTKVYSDAQRAGGGLLFGRTLGQDIAKLHLQQMTDFATRDPKGFAAMAKSVGMTPVRLVRGLYRATQKNLWFVNDTLMLSRVLELQHLRGIDMVEAIREAEREIASYDMPTKVLKSSTLADLLSSNKLVSFGRYDTNRISIWKNMVTDLLGKSRGDGIGTWSDLKVRGHALDQAAMVAALIVFGAPMANQLFQKITGNKAARLMMPGPLFVMDMAKRLKDGDLGGALPFHMAALVSKGYEFAHNLNPFGKPLVNGHKSYAGMAADVIRAGASLFPPVNAALNYATGATTGADTMAKIVFNARLPKPNADAAQQAALKKANAEARSQEAKDPLAKAIRMITGGRPIPMPGRTRAVNPFGTTGTSFDQQSGVFGKAKNPFDSQ